MVTVSFNCDSGTLGIRGQFGYISNDVVFQFKAKGPATAIPYVYPSNLAGVGVRIKEQSTQLFLATPGAPINSVATTSFCWRQMAPPYADEGCGKLPPSKCPLASGGGICNISFNAKLVKTGPVVGGALGFPFASISYYSPGVTNGFDVGTLSVGGTVRVGAVCKMQDMNVSLGRASVSALSSASLTPVPFNINLTGCEANQGIDLSFATMRQAGAKCDGLMNNATGATAQGVGIKVSRNSNVPLCWGSKITYTSAADGSLAVPMAAVMQKLADPVTPGTVWGAIVVSASYH